MSPKSKKLKMLAHSKGYKNKSSTCKQILRNFLQKRQKNSKKRNPDNTSNSDACSKKQICAVPQMAQSNAFKALTIVHHFLNEIFERYSELIPDIHTTKKYFKCLPCQKVCIDHNIRSHLAAEHLEIFFSHLKSRFMNKSTAEISDFGEHCQYVLLDEIQLAKEFTSHVKQKSSNASLVCTYCDDLWYRQDRLKLHMLWTHYNVLENRLMACCQETEMEHVSEQYLNLQSTPMAKLDQNLAPRHQHNLMFENNAASDPGQETSSSIINGQVSSAMVNMEQYQSLNFGHENMDQMGPKGLSQVEKIHYTNPLDERNSIYFPMTTPIRREQFAKRSHYENVYDQYFNVSLRIQKPVLTVGPNLSGNGAIPNVSPHLSSLSTSSNSNNWSEPAIANVMESSNHGDAIMKQHYPKILEPENWQCYHTPASLYQQQQVQVEWNQSEILASHSFQGYSPIP